MVVTFSCSTMRQMPSGSNLREAASTMVLPWWKQMKAAHWAAPCMRGAAVAMVRVPADSSTRAARSSGAAGGSARPMAERSMAAKKMSSCRHITPLGMPVVPPV